MAKAGTHWIVTANFTADGGVAYRRADGTWSRLLSEAHLWESEEAAQPVAAAAAKQEQFEVCDPYAIDVALGEAGIEPLTARERIRATGPTVPIRRPDGPIDRARA